MSIGHSSVAYVDTFFPDWFTELKGSQRQKFFHYDFVGCPIVYSGQKIKTEIISKSKLDANNIFKEARENVLKEINTKKETLDKQIDEEIKKVEQEINLLRKGASEKINKIAIETTSELLVKLIGTEVNNSSISAIVDDLSKRNGDKYYGN